MPKCAIFRANKLNRRGAYAMAHHALREGVSVPNAMTDGEGNHVPPQVVAGHSSVAAVTDEIKALIASAKEKGQRWRSNNTAAVDLLFTYTHGGIDSLEDQDRYFRLCLDWVKSTWPTAKVLTAAVHRDETTPHMQLLLAPVTERGVLSAKELMGGPAMFHGHQNSFWAACGQPFDLERGTPGSPAKHIPVQKFYAAMEAGGEAPVFAEVPPLPKKPGVIERLQPGYGEKMADYERLKKQRAAVLAANAKARKALEQQAEAGRNLSPLMLERQATLYRNAVAAAEVAKGEVKKLRKALDDSEGRAEAATERSEQLLAEAKVAAQALDAVSRTISPLYVRLISKQLGVPLVPGKGLIDQLRRAKVADNLIDAAAVLNHNIELAERTLSAPAEANDADGHQQQPERPRG